MRLRRMAHLAVLCLLPLAGCVRIPIEPGSPSLPPPPARLLPTPAPPPPPLVQRPAPPPAPLLPLDVLFAIQTRLDRAHFSPGGIDGRWGSKSEKALAAWQKNSRRPATGTIDDSVRAALGATNGIMSTYAVSAADHAALGPYPSSWLERSQQDRMGYASVEELVAEKFHLFRATLRRLNPDAAWPDPPAGTVLAVPDVSSKPLPPLSKIEIRLGQKTLRAYDENGKLVAQFPCSIAADKAKRPAGETLRVVLWAENPDYTFDPDLFPEVPEAATIAKKLRIPPGPNNPVGLAWIGLDRPGYGIHGTPAPEDVSKTESHGCFRLTNWDALKLVRAVRAGLPVVVLP
ncbi:MAG: L,D-transpeptidase family protein [Kiritimatiellia bacterium]